MFSFLFSVSFLVVLSYSLTEWELLAHGSTRTPLPSSVSSNNVWNITTDQNFNLIEWQVPYSFGPTLPGGIDQSLVTGNIHIQLLGTERVNIGAEWPGGGSTKQYGPPYILEIDIKTGNIVRTYDLSKYGKTFYSIVRYTPSGNPLVAVCNANAPKDITILILDTESTNVLWSFTSKMEPMLIQITNTKPSQLLYAGMSSDGSLDFDNNGIMPINKNEIINNDISTIIFANNGTKLFNNGFTNEATGVYLMDLPLTTNNRERMIISGCETFPWVLASSIKSNIYAVCSYNYVGAFDETGRNKWKISLTKTIQPDWLILDDDESTVIIGNTQHWVGLDVNQGSVIFNTSLNDIRINSDGKDLKCFESGQPWAPRHPIPMPSKKLAILCSTNNRYDIRLIDITTGKLIGSPIIFDKIPAVDMLIADDQSFYGFGYNSQKISAQKINM